jgi:hypothetical protein
MMRDSPAGSTPRRCTRSSPNQWLHQIRSHGVPLHHQERAEAPSPARWSAGGNDDDEDPRPKQTRRTLSDLARDFIDEYLDTYISLSAEPKARARLYLEILAQSQTRKETLDSEGWDVPLIQKRLQNALAKKNLAARRAEADE